MLRLRVAPSLPWVDSQNRVRSPFENLVLLDASARSALSGARPHGLVSWEIGIVSDDWDVPSHSKPREVGGDDGSTAIGMLYAVGADRAAELSLDVASLWLALFDFLSPDQHLKFLLRDAVWDARRREWLDMHDALMAGLLGDGLRSHRSTAESWCWLDAGMQTFGELAARWWPSAAGGVVVLDLGARHREVEAIDSAELGEIVVYAATSKAYDNLGFQLLTRADSWDVLRAGLEQRGWFDGVPLERVLN